MKNKAKYIINEKSLNYTRQVKQQIKRIELTQQNKSFNCLWRYYYHYRFQFHHYHYYPLLHHLV